MRLSLRFLKVAGVPQPSPGSLSTPSSSVSLDEFLHPVSVKALQWEQQQVKEELYQSIFHAFSEHDNLPPDEADQSLAGPAATTKPTVLEKDVHEHPSSAVISFQTHAPEGLSGAPKESSSIKEGSSTVKTSSSKSRRNLIHRKSARLLASVKTALRRPNYNKTNETLITVVPEKTLIEEHFEITSNNNPEISSTDSFCGTGVELGGPSYNNPNQTLITVVPEKQRIEEHLEITSNKNLEISSTNAVCGTDDGLSDGTTNPDAKPSFSDEHPRKASDNTILSEGSKTSSATVYRHVDFSIENIEIDTSTHHVRPTSYDPSRIPASLDARKFELISYSGEFRPSSDDNSKNSLHNVDGDTQVFESTSYVPPAVSSLPEYSLPQRLFSDTELKTRQEKALHAFNILAEEFYFYALIKPEHDPINYQCFIRPKTSITGAIFRKVRSVRSYLRLTTPDENVPTLRRVKTLTGLSEKYNAMGSLKGRTLEKLGRFGGYGSLTLPGDFAPAVMRLPAFLASIIDYLQIHGPKSRNIFFEPGDLGCASRIYDHYADQILSVEKDSDITGLTARRTDISSTEVEMYHFEEDFLRGRFHVLPVAWTFKTVLMDLPGGILGAPHLYPTLVEIAYCPFPDEPAVPQAGHNGALPTLSPTRARAISLAILALTNNSQFDLICAVFGLCSLLEYETHQLLDFYRTKNVPRINQATLLSRDRILEVFAPLLAEETKEVGPEDRGCDAYIVMGMMLDYWRTVSHELRTFDM